MKQHLVADTRTDTSVLLATAQEELEEHFHIKHVTLQVESPHLPVIAACRVTQRTTTSPQDNAS